MSRSYCPLKVGFSAIDPKKHFLKGMRRVATGKIIIFPESLFQYKEFLISVEHIIGDNRTQIQEKLRLRCDFRSKKNKKFAYRA